MKPKIDKKTLTIEQSTALEQYEQNQTLAKQLIQLKKLGDSIEGLVFFVKENETKQPKFQKEIGSLLVDIRESLTALTSKKTPEYPDYAKPVVEALKPLEKAIKAIDMKPQVTVEGAKIESPDVKVDLKGVEKIVKDIPKAFKDSIKLIPKPEKTDFKPLLKAWEGISEQLVSIETATRMKPLPGSIAINNFSDMTGGDASAANQVLQTALLTTIDADTGNIATEVAGLLTDTELRASPVPVSGTVTATPSVTGGGTEATAQRVTIANDSTGVLSVDDNGGSLTVDGTVGISGTVPVSGTFWQSTQPVSLASLPALPAGTNNIGDVDVTSAVSATFDHGSDRDIDTSAEQITSTSFACKFGVTLKADITNTGIIYVGNSDVTAGTTAATDGFPLSAGETLTLEVNNSNIPYAIASANNQIVYWMAV